MGLFNLKGWFNEVKRLNSGNYAGWVSGSVAHVKQGHRRAIVLENNQVVCLNYRYGDDIIIKKEDIVSLECAAQNIKKPWGKDSYILCNSYAITFANGEFGTFDIFVDKAAEFTIILKK